MDDDRGRDALALAEAALALAMRDDVTEAEALVMTEDSALTRFANSEIHQNVAETNVSINLRVVIGRRVGVASSGRTDAEGLRRLADQARAIAGVVEELDDWGGLPGPTEVRAVPAAYSATTAGASPEFRAEAVRAVIGAADDAGVTAYGSFATGLESMAVANSAGARAAGTRTTSQLITVSMGPGGGTGYAEAAAVDASTIDAGALGREAADKARATASAVLVEPGDYPVVLEEYAVVDLVDMLGYLGFSALAVQEERSFVEPGKRIGSDLVTIVDDGYDPAGLPLPFDFEGVAKRRVSLLEAGVCRDVVYDAQTAARDGVASTGHGLPAPNPWGPFPLNMVMSSGSASRDELIGGLDRGLLVTRFHYTNPVHPKLAIVTGMTRDGTFLVEGGRIVGPVKNLRFTQSYLAALAGTVAVGRDRKTLKGFLGGVVVPALRIDGWTFTGGTEH
ncbi:MAG TPA: TldD/PmbA family protein [Candidatus Limnocylindrales bacterium]|jgi:predicted Zn-dependent protease|nr:TldD/PmbA family protein [Candidatus Limnocylindrales bacterium]